MHVIIEENLYDAKYVKRWVEGFEALCSFVLPYTPAMGRKGNGDTGRRDREPGPGSQQGQAGGGFPLRLPRLSPPHGDVLPPFDPDPECPDGQHRKQGRPLYQKGSQGRRLHGRAQDLLLSEVSRDGGHAPLRRVRPGQVPHCRSVPWGRLYAAPCDPERGPLSDQGPVCLPLRPAAVQPGLQHQSQGAQKNWI